MRFCLTSDKIIRLLQHKGFFRTAYQDHWAVVHRARPWDNPQIVRSDVAMLFYANRDAPVPQYTLIKPQIRPLSADPGGELGRRMSSFL